MRPSRKPIFFGWNTPWLPRLATYLLHDWNHAESSPREDLSRTVVILSGGRAGRRLLELLALQAEQEQLSLIPPHIVTLREAVTMLLIPPDQIAPEASEWTCRLAWRESCERLPKHLLQCIQPLSSDTDLKHGGEHLLDIIETLADELGSVGLDFQNIAARVEELFPESAEREKPRWEALASAQKNYRQLLASWGYCDPTDLLRSYLTSGVALKGFRVMIAGVVESRPLFQLFFKKIDCSVMVIAPEEHAAGFSVEGMLVTKYWIKHPALIQDAQLIPCERSEDQAKELLRLISTIQEPASSVSVAVSDVTTLPLLRDSLKREGMETRWAGGLTFRGGRLYQLLKAIANFLNHEASFGPTIQAVRSLVQHPDIAPHCLAPEDFLIQLDRLEREHLPPFVDKKSLSHFKKNQEFIIWIEELEHLLGLRGLPSEPLSLLQGIVTLRDLLWRLLGQRQVSADSPEGHYFLGCLEQCLQVLEEAEEMSHQISRTFTISDLIEKILDLLIRKNIPEAEETEAIELLGWLEMAADDAPCTIITSCYEGSFPTAPMSHPLLPEGLRQRLGLSHEATILARDQYLLQTILATRAELGQTILIAPRYNGRGEPARPSRLLTLGLPLEELPKRVLVLTQVSLQKEMTIDVSQSPYPSSTSSFQARPRSKERISSVTVSGLRTYLQSPRLFYLQHVLKLKEVEEAPLEMDARHFGNLIHQVLGVYAHEGINTRLLAAETPDLAAWLRKKLVHIAGRYFAPGPTLPIEFQLEEAAVTLDGFAKAQVEHNQAGWRIIAAENPGEYQSRPLEKKIILPSGCSLILQGRIDRIDWHEEHQRWMIIDYKTRHDQAWKRATPSREHFQKQGETILWKDLQLPLYLELAPHWERIQQSGLPLPAIDNTDLCYFQLPIETDQAGLSVPFDESMITPALHEARRLMEAILEGDFEALGEIDPRRTPTLAALCGVSLLG